ncbi:7275_t:CDS:2 [Acaulospora morrowiae]|uniref:7275_t:CDS:1 n=1 Tax=Acaulospora morrowiae TaxID=94023 RepID=A0A9N8VLB6_9GLOM|nr:7275_t:CDS:2 [Acaulospora morrowiae]
MSSQSSSPKSSAELYGTCPNCCENRFHYYWCRQCEYYGYQSAYPNWTSKNSCIDLVIQSIQANSGSIFSFIEWIEYDQFENVEYIGKGSFSTVFRATWKEGPRDGPPKFEEENYDHSNNRETNESQMPKWERRGRTAVILKSLSKSQNIKPKFFTELRILSRYTPDLESYDTPGLLRTYGITRNPQNQEFMLVLQYAEQNSLYEYLATQSYASTRNTFSLLRSIADGLFAIHKSGLVHGNLHGGNVLVDAFNCAYIGDAGVSKPADPLISHMPEKYREIISWCLDALPANRPSIDELLMEISELEKPDQNVKTRKFVNSHDDMNGKKSAWNEKVRRALYKERQRMRPNLKAKYFSRFISFLDNANGVNDMMSELKNSNIELAESRDYIMNKVHEVSKYGCVTDSITLMDDDFRKLVLLGDMKQKYCIL